MTDWAFAGASVEGDRFEIGSGLNVWDHAWVPVLRGPPPAGDEIEDLHESRETVFATDPLYGSNHLFNVYEIVEDDRRIRFAARELSASLWGFYVPQEV